MTSKKIDLIKKNIEDLNSKIQCITEDISNMLDERDKYSLKSVDNTTKLINSFLIENLTDYYNIENNLPLNKISIKDIDKMKKIRKNFHEKHDELKIL